MELIVHTFELKLLFMIGFLPVLDNCVLCGKPLQRDSQQTIRFSHTHCGVCCREGPCAVKTEAGQNLSASIWNCLKYISDAPIEKVYSFTLDKSLVPELSELATRYLCDRLERCYTKLRMLKDFEAV